MRNGLAIIKNIVDVRLSRACRGRMAFRANKCGSSRAPLPCLLAFESLGSRLSPHHRITGKIDADNALKISPSNRIQSNHIIPSSAIGSVIHTSLPFLKVGSLLLTVLLIVLLCRRFLHAPGAECFIPPMKFSAYPLWRYPQFDCCIEAGCRGLELPSAAFGEPSHLDMRISPSLGWCARTRSE